MDNYCYNCMHKCNEDVCENCKKLGLESTSPHHLKPGTILNNRYLVGKALGEGGFGITYIGRDLNLDMRIAVKEFYPSGYANRYGEITSDITISGTKHSEYFMNGKSKFLSEARVLAKFSGDKNIVDVRDYFEANNTAYIVMEFVDGITLKEYLKENSVFDYTDIISKMLPLLESLGKVHNRGLIHRDISPDNIMLLKDGTLKLMDFGAARDVNFEDRRSLSIMLKPGYAPEEQYRSKGIQGPWTDIYALCATIYRCITGVTPDDAMERVFDDCLEKPSKFNADITIDQENVLMKGLSISYKDRYQNVHELVGVLKDVLDGNDKERISNIVINCDDSDEIALHPDDNSDATLFLEETEQNEETVLIEESEVEDTTVVMLDDIDSTSIETETSMVTDEVSHNSTDVEDKVVVDIKTTSSQNNVTVCCEYCGAIMQKSQRYCSVCYKTVKIKQDIPHKHQEAPIVIKATSEDKKKPIDRTSIESMKSCPLCGAVVKRNSGYCFACGAKIK